MPQLAPNSFASNPRPAAGRVLARLAAGALLVWPLLAAPAQAATPPWYGAPYRYVVLSQDLRAVFEEFGRNVAVPVAISDAVRGRARGTVAGDTAGAFLDALTGANGLVWYYDGGILHISAATELGTRVLQTGGADAGAVAREMRRLGLADDRFAPRSTANNDALTVSGPPAFLAAAEALVRSMAPKPVIAGDDPRVRIFRGGWPVETVSGTGEEAGAKRPDTQAARR